MNNAGRAQSDGRRVQPEYATASRGQIQLLILALGMVLAPVEIQTSVAVAAAAAGGVVVCVVGGGVVGGGGDAVVVVVVGGVAVRVRVGAVVVV